MRELRCIDLTKLYKANKKALDSVSFTAQGSGTFALIGRNGAGKTTLIRILSTQLEPTSGSATINGLDVMKDSKRIRSMIATVPQEARTITWMTPVQTILSYLMWRGFGYGEAKKRAIEALERLGLGEYCNVLTRSLSGGTKRKILVATVLASEAEVLFLDEPTTGLDPISRREFWDVLKLLARERFVFLTTHYLEEAEQLADEIGILSEGRLVTLGSLAELREGARYQYSIKVPPKTPVPDVAHGKVTIGRDGQSQILTNEAEAFDISRRFSQSGARFSVAPVSLDDIFFHLVGEEPGDDGAG